MKLMFFTSNDYYEEYKINTTKVYRGYLVHGTDTQLTGISLYDAQGIKKMVAFKTVLISHILSYLGVGK